MKHEIAHMRQSGGGAIVNNASIAGLIAEPGISAYIAAKHGVMDRPKRLPSNTQIKTFASMHWHRDWSTPR